MKKPSLVLLPAVIALYSVVHSRYVGQDLEHPPAAEIVLSILAAVLAAYCITYLIARKGNPSDLLVASVVVIVTLFYGYFRDQLFAWTAVTVFVRQFFWNKDNAFCILLMSLLTWGIARVLKSNPARSAQIGSFGIVFFLALTGMDLMMPRHVEPTVGAVLAYHPDSIHTPGPKPDVYFLIFDSETSPGSLEKYWHYADDSVVHRLVEKGFFVGKHCRSNYNWTVYSIASTLNMSYMKDNSANSYTKDYPQRLDCEVQRIFARNGYSFHNLTYFEINEHPRLGSIIQHDLWGKTLFYFLYDRFSNRSINAYREGEKDLMKATSDSLTALIEEKSVQSKFVYAHFYVPHTPAFIDEDGRDYPHGSIDPQDMKGYLGQVVYSNKMMLGFVEKIQRRTNGTAIIIIQGDHGYRFLEGPKKLDEQFTIFKAVYFPNREYAQFNDSTSSINTFRILFNSQHWASLPLENDSSFNVITNMLKTFR